MLTLTMHACGLLALLIWITSTSARLYATFPIADTVWTGGQTEHVTWIDDGREPTLSKMGKMDIELYVGETTRVATLGKNVDPDTKSYKVKVDPDWGHDGSDYHIRFVFPSETIFTADFTINTGSGTSTSGSPSSHPHKAKFLTTRTSSSAALNIPSGASLYTPAVTFVLPNATIISHLAPTYVTPPPAVPAATAKPSFSFPGYSYNPVPGVSNTVIQVEAEPTMVYSGHGQASGRRIDVEKLKFRVVFILWPAMIGLTMAL